MTDSKESSPVEINVQGKNLLVIEDDVILQNLLTHKLASFRERGVSIHYAFDAVQALAMVHEQTPDAVLLDILLPGMTGFEFLEKIQAEDPTFKDIPVIIFSNLSSDDDKKHAEDLGVAAFLCKADTTLEELAIKIESVLGA